MESKQAMNPDNPTTWLRLLYRELWSVWFQLSGGEREVRDDGVHHSVCVL